ncbi:MAG: RNase adapter RapZ [Acidimicrobiales bacterium]
MGTVNEFLIIAGMSGAGRSTAADTLEDLGWFVIDNLPSALVDKVAELAFRPGPDAKRVAIVVGRGGGERGDAAIGVAKRLRDNGDSARIVFLDAPDDVLVRRFEGTRRRHPLAAEGVMGSIAMERQVLSGLKDLADVVIDTGELNVHQLRDRLVGLFGTEEASSSMHTSIVSFGYKHGVPIDVDLLFDCRFLPNPHWVEQLRPYTGLDEPVRDYVLGQPETVEFLAKLDDMLGLLLPAYAKEGKSYLTIGVGCTGGRHRSVVLAEEIAARARARGFGPTVHHRDIAR